MKTEKIKSPFLKELYPIRPAAGNRYKHSFSWVSPGRKAGVLGLKKLGLHRGHFHPGLAVEKKRELPAMTGLWVSNERHNLLFKRIDVELIIPLRDGKVKLNG